MNSNDESVLKMLAGAHFAPGSKLTLPSGKVIEGNEAQAMTSFYAADKRDEPSYEPTESEMVLRRVQQQVERWREDLESKSREMPLAPRLMLKHCIADMELAMRIVRACGLLCPLGGDEGEVPAARSAMGARASRTTCRPCTRTSITTERAESEPGDPSAVTVTLIGVQAIDPVTIHSRPKEYFDG